jgi:hypothetical protein
MYNQCLLFVKRKSAYTFVHVSYFYLSYQLLILNEIWYMHYALVLKCDFFPRMRLMYFYNGLFYFMKENAVKKALYLCLYMTVSFKRVFSSIYQIIVLRKLQVIPLIGNFPCHGTISNGNYLIC